MFYRRVSEERYRKRLRANLGRPAHNSNGNQWIYGFPLTRGAWCNSRLKVSALDEIKKTYLRRPVLSCDNEKREKLRANHGVPVPGRSLVQQQLKNKGNAGFLRSLESEVVQYIGIAANEGKRTERHIDKAKMGLESLPLIDAGWTEQMCREWCEKNNLLSPIYSTATRGGCWFCHNQGVDQLRLLRKNYPDLWALLMKWDSDSPVTFRPDGHSVHDFDKRFQWEDDGYWPSEKHFRWADIDNAQMNIFQFLKDPNKG